MAVIITSKKRELDSGGRAVSGALPCLFEEVFGAGKMMKILRMSEGNVE